MITVQEKMERFLKLQGGLYSFEDIVELIKTGEMQSFCEGDTWVVTQVNNFPRKRVLSIVLAVGDIKDVKKLEPRVDEFAKEVGAELVMAFGRPGWGKHMHGEWQTRYCVFDKVI